MLACYLGFALSAAIAASILACGGGDERARDPTASNGDVRATATAGPARPGGLIAIGHSALTGENSDPARPGLAAKENSWATGTSPDVNSVYQRLVAVRPEMEGHVANYAEGGAGVAALAGQARLALKEVPTPALVIIQTIDNDIRCDGTDDVRFEGFGKRIAEALSVITEASPNSRILIVSQPGRPPPSLACGSEESQTTLLEVIEGYEAEQARVCARLPQCSSDGGAFAQYTVDASDLSNDGNHETVSGHARLAETIWPIVADILDLP